MIKIDRSRYFNDSLETFPLIPFSVEVKEYENTPMLLSTVTTQKALQFSDAELVDGDGDFAYLETITVLEDPVESDGEPIEVEKEVEHYFYRYNDSVYIVLSPSHTEPEMKEAE